MFRSFRRLLAAVALLWVATAATAQNSIDGLPESGDGSGYSHKFSIAVIPDTQYLFDEDRYDPEVLALLREVPFPDRPPRYVRARLSLYTFTRWGARDLWNSEDVGLYCPPMARRAERDDSPGDSGTGEAPP